MVIGAPAEQAVEIFNELVRMVPAETAGVARIQWRLRALARSRPGDAAVGVALLLAQLMLGNGAEAIRQADHLWRFRHGMGGDQLGAFLSELLHLGMYERAAEILREIRGHPIESTIPNLLASYLRVAWDSGAAEQLDAISNSPAGAQLLFGWQTFLENLKLRGLTQHLAARQKIVQEETFGQRCFAELILTPTEETETVELTHYVYVRAGYDERTAIEETIRSRLDNYFHTVGLGEANHWDLVTEVLVPITAGPSWHKDAMVRVA